MLTLKKKRNGEIDIKGTLPCPFDAFKLRLSASPEAWKELYESSPDVFGKLGQALYDGFISPVMGYLTVKKPRGVHGEGKAQFVAIMKYRVAYTYNIIKFCLHSSPDCWPDDFNRIQDEVKLPLKQSPHSGSERKLSLGPHLKKGLNALTLTIYLMEEKYGKERSHNGMKPWHKKPESFYATYVKNNSTSNFWRSHLEMILDKDKKLPKGLPIVDDNPNLMNVLMKFRSKKKTLPDSSLLEPPVS